VQLHTRNKPDLICRDARDGPLDCARFTFSLYVKGFVNRVAHLATIAAPALRDGDDCYFRRKALMRSA
jgi:hypothetical protein